MIAEIIGISIDILIIIAIIYFIVRGIKNRLTKNRWPKELIISIVVAILVIPATLYSIINATAVLATPIPVVKVPNSSIKIAGTHTTGIVHGSTTSNTLVYLKENVDKDEDPITKTTYSNSSGNFSFNKLEDDMDYKLWAKNKYHKSKTVKISVGDIPKAAYTKFEVDGADEYGDLTLKSDDSNKANISGTASKNSKITISDTNFNTVKVIQPDENGKWSFTLNGPKKKSTDYTLNAKVAHRLESDDVSITVKNPKYVKQAENKANNQETTNDSTNQNNNQDNTDSTKKNKTPKKSKSEAQQGFENDLNTYLNNKYPGVSCTFDGETVTLTVPDEVAYLGKHQMKAYFKPIYDRLETFASANDLDSIPTFIAQTSDGTTVARTTLFGYKVYTDN